MCRVLSVSVGGFYAWMKRPPSPREREDGEITEQIVKIYQQHKGRYGSPRIHEQLRDEWSGSSGPSSGNVPREQALLLMRRPARLSLSTSRSTTTECASTPLWAISARFSLS